MNEKEQKWLDEIKRKANEWLSISGNSQNKLALGAGLSAGTISPFMRGTYTGDNLKVAEALEKFFELELERRGFERNRGFVKTRQSDQIWRACVQAHAFSAMSVIIGDSGLGKTATLKEYSKIPNVYYIKCHPFMRGRTGFLQQLCTSVGVPALGNQISCYNRLAKIASEKGTLIILDDAQALNNKGATNTTVFEVIRALFDEGVGFVICGNGKVRETVTETDTEELYQQFASRARSFEIRSDFKEEDVQSVIDEVVNGELAPEQFEYLFNIATKFYGSLHLVVRILELAVVRAKNKRVPMSLQLLKDAAKHHVSQIKPQYRTKRKPGENLKNAKQHNKNNESIGREKGQASSQVA